MLKVVNIVWIHVKFRQNWNSSVAVQLAKTSDRPSLRLRFDPITFLPPSKTVSLYLDHTSELPSNCSICLPAILWTCLLNISRPSNSIKPVWITYPFLVHPKKQFNLHPFSILRFYVIAMFSWFFFDFAKWRWEYKKLCRSFMTFIGIKTQWRIKFKLAISSSQAPTLTTSWDFICFIFISYFHFFIFISGASRNG